MHSQHDHLKDIGTCARKREERLGTHICSPLRAGCETVFCHTSLQHTLRLTVQLSEHFFRQWDSELVSPYCSSPSLQNTGLEQRTSGT